MKSDTSSEAILRDLLTAQSFDVAGGQEMLGQLTKTRSTVDSRHKLLLSAVIAAIILAIAVVPTVLINRAGTAPATSHTIDPSLEPKSDTEALRTYYFGASSVPGYTLNSVVIGQNDMGSYNYQLGFQFAVLQVRYQPNGGADGYPPITIHGRPGSYHKDETAPGSNTSTGQYLRWNLVGNLWVTLSADDNKGSNLSKSALISLAKKIRPQVDDKIAPIRVGFLPPKTTLTWFEYNTADSQMVDLPSAAWASLDFNNLEIDVSYQPTTPFGNWTAALLAKLMPARWRHSTVAGHQAWISSDVILLGWGPMQVALRSNAPDGGVGLGEETLLKIAKTLSLPAINHFGSGFPLTEALPPGSY